jgi:tripartite-type tricarboxylate transporter receptor subunit TctC
MKLPRRNFLHLAAGAAALPAISWIAWAQAYPTRPVRLIVGTTAGGVQDIVARLIAQWLSERFGQPIIVENRGGGSGNIGAEAVVRALPDGYTLLLVTANNAINATLFENLKFSFVRDIAPVAGISRNPLVMEVNPSLPVTTVPEFIAYVKANPGKVNFASAGIGSTPHVSAELFNMMSGFNMIHVPYRGGAPAVTDLLGGQVQVLFGNMESSIEHIRAGRLRALAVTTSTRSAALPDIPTIAEFVPGYEASGWQGIGAPKDTPIDIVNRLNEEINAGLTDPKVKTRLADLGGAPLVQSPAKFGKLLADETEKWGKVIRAANIKPQG